MIGGEVSLLGSGSAIFARRQQTRHGGDVRLVGIYGLEQFLGGDCSGRGFQGKVLFTPNLAKASV
jgi:hypothetical protein